MSNGELLLLYSVIGMALGLLAISIAEEKEMTLPFQAVVPIIALWPIILVIIFYKKFTEKNKKSSSSRK